MSAKVVELSAKLVSAWLRQGVHSADEIERALKSFASTLQELGRSGAKTQAVRPETLSWRESIRYDHIVCLECGKSFELLSNRHLGLHGLTPTTYKKKRHIPRGQALSALRLSKKRRKIARDLGMGVELAAWRAARRQK